jgi:hypothetical protein
MSHFSDDAPPVDWKNNEQVISLILSIADVEKLNSVCRAFTLHSVSLLPFRRVLVEKIGDLLDDIVSQSSIAMTPIHLLHRLASARDRWNVVPRGKRELSDEYAAHDLLMFGLFPKIMEREPNAINFHPEGIRLARAIVNRVIVLHSVDSLDMRLLMGPDSLHSIAIKLIDRFVVGGAPDLFVDDLVSCLIHLQKHALHPSIMSILLHSEDINNPLHRENVFRLLFKDELQSQPPRFDLIFAMWNYIDIASFVNRLLWNDQTPLGIAVSWSNLALCRKLVECGANADGYYDDSDDEKNLAGGGKKKKRCDVPPIITAAQNQDREMLDFLIKKCEADYTVDRDSTSGVILSAILSDQEFSDSEDESDCEGWLNYFFRVDSAFVIESMTIEVLNFFVFGEEGFSQGLSEKSFEFILNHKRFYFDPKRVHEEIFEGLEKDRCPDSKYSILKRWLLEQGMEIEDSDDDDEEEEKEKKNLLRESGQRRQRE